MLDLGFSTELDAVFAALPKKRQTLLFSATFSEVIRSLAKARLRNPLTIEISPPNSTVKAVKQWMVPVDKKRKTELFLFMRKDRRWGQVLVFVKTKRGADELVATLIAKKIKADAIHGDKPQAPACARWKASRPVKYRFSSPPTSLPAAWTSTTCRRLSISTCPSSPKTTSTVSAAPAVPALPAKPSRWSAPMRRRCLPLSKRYSNKRSAEKKNRASNPTTEFR
jgi:hypothetical protein